VERCLELSHTFLFHKLRQNVYNMYKVDVNVFFFTKNEKIVLYVLYKKFRSYPEKKKLRVTSTGTDIF